MRLLVTGSEGLIGSVFVRECARLGHEVIPFDIVRKGVSTLEDICDEVLVSERAADCDGIVHLAAISRVVWGELRPDLTHRINVAGTEALVKGAMSSKRKPWFLFASSREIYGNPARDKVVEDDPRAPVNAYGRSKADAEIVLDAAREDGLRTAILRLSNVYGGRRDHPDRAVPALVARAVAGEALTITGGDNYFDFVHVDDCVSGLLAAMEHLTAGERAFPPVHLTTGVATSLRDLAYLALDICGRKSGIDIQPPRAFDVSGFCGNPDRARQVLDWQAATDLRAGLEMLAEDFRLHGPLAPVTIPDPDVIRLQSKVE